MEHLQEAIAMWQRLLLRNHPDHPDVALSLKMGTVYGDMGDHQQALKY